MQNEPTNLLPQVVMLVAPGFSPLHCAIPSLMFGDILPEKALFKLTLCRVDAPLAPSLGAAKAEDDVSPSLLAGQGGFWLQAQADLQPLAHADLIIVPFWDDPQREPVPAVLAALTAARQRGAQIVGLCLGAYVLAYAGLLDGHRAVTHWQYAKDFAARFPRVAVEVNALYIDDGGCVTSAGTAAGLDCCLYLIRQRYGGEIANQIARRLVVAPYREGGQAQFIQQPLPHSRRDSQLSALLATLPEELAEPHSIDSLAARLALSRRSFTRRFRYATGGSLAQWLISARLYRSQELLEITSHDIEHIATLVGFKSGNVLRQHFKARFGVTPRQWRQQFHLQLVPTR
ncbi:MAG: GlxA family transcriptional regulator [Aeromonas sp.]